VKFDPSLLLLLVMIVLVVSVFRRGSRQRREIATLQAGLVPGAQVVTSSGLYATVVSSDGDVVVLETAPGQRSRWDRRAVIKVLPEGSEPGGRTDAASGSTLRTADPDSTADSDDTTPPGPA
jgi:preprotein translocase subunit YajC